MELKLSRLLDQKRFRLRRLKLSPSLKPFSGEIALNLISQLDRVNISRDKGLRLPFPVLNNSFHTSKQDYRVFKPFGTQSVPKPRNALRFCCFGTGCK